MDHVGTEPPRQITLTDLRASERRIARAEKRVAKLDGVLLGWREGVRAEKERHSALVETYRVQSA